MTLRGVCQVVLERIVLPETFLKVSYYCDVSLDNSDSEGWTVGCTVVDILFSRPGVSHFGECNLRLD